MRPVIEIRRQIPAQLCTELFYGFSFIPVGRFVGFRLLICIEDYHILVFCGQGLVPACGDKAFPAFFLIDIPGRHFAAEDVVGVSKAADCD